MHTPPRPLATGEIATADTSDKPANALPPGLLPPKRRTGATRWLHEGVRTLLLRPPCWHDLPATPVTIIVLIGVGILLSLIIHRLWIVGPALFYWPALLVGWLAPAATAWACYALLRTSESRIPAGAPSAPHLFCLLLIQGCLLAAIYGLLWAIFINADSGLSTISPPTLLRGIWVGFWLWLAAAQTLALWRSARCKPQALAMSALLLSIGILENGAQQETLWIEDASATANLPPRTLQLTQELTELQPKLLEQRLHSLQMQRPGTIDLYALTFAPYAHEDVFRRESQMVSDVLTARFDTAGRSLQLVNHVDSVGDWPWATPLNLKRAIERVAALMDRDEDILFIHLTSHGAQDGALAAQFWPLTVAPVTPQELKSWLDEAGIRHRIVSVSACYSGSWIAPLSDDHTLVMTAADSENTSFGCGRKSELTYFGRAVYDEQLRLHTRSFVEAHAAARPLIEQRERAAGKDDGYSNPQIAAGEGIRRQLERLRLRLEAG